MQVLVVRRDVLGEGDVSEGVVKTWHMGSQEIGVWFVQDQLLVLYVCTT